MQKASTAARNGRFDRRGWFDLLCRVQEKLLPWEITELKSAD